MKHIMKFEKWNPFKRSDKSFIDIAKENIFSKNRTIKLHIGFTDKFRKIVFQTNKYVISIRYRSNDIVNKDISIIMVFDKVNKNKIREINIEKELFESLWNFCIKEGFKVEKAHHEVSPRHYRFKSDFGDKDQK